MPDMPKTAPSDAQEREAYNRFIHSLELRDIVLARVEAEARVPSINPAETGIQADFDVRDDECESEPNLCQVLAQLKVELMQVKSGERLGAVDVTLRLTYSSEEPITDAIRERFKAANVPLNAWPYLREYVQQTMTRFGWPPFILPPYLPSQRSNDDSPSQKETRKTGPVNTEKRRAKTPTGEKSKTAAGRTLSQKK